MLWVGAHVTGQHTHHGGAGNFPRLLRSWAPQVRALGCESFRKKQSRGWGVDSARGSGNAFGNCFSPQQRSMEPRTKPPLFLAKGPLDFHVGRRQTSAGIRDESLSPSTPQPLLPQVPGSWGAELTSLGIPPGPPPHTLPEPRLPARASHSAPPAGPSLSSSRPGAPRAFRGHRHQILLRPGLSGLSSLTAQHLCCAPKGLLTISHHKSLREGTFQTLYRRLSTSP